MQHTKALFLGALFVGMGTVTAINEIGIGVYPPSGQFSDGVTRGFRPSDVRSCMGARALAAIGDSSSQRHWHRCATTLVQTQALWGFDLRYWSLLVAAAFTLASAFGFALVLRLDRPPARVLRGRRLLAGPTARRAFAQASQVESRVSGQGLEFLPDLPVSRERETRHWLIWGSVGAGKTQTMLHLILAAIGRGDGVLVLDVKGDMTAGLPGEPLLMAPQDRRSLAWDVASDCRTKQDARELAARLIPKSDDPMWLDAAREIVVACVAALQATQPERWSWHDLHEMAIADTGALLHLAKTYHLQPGAAQGRNLGRHRQPRAVQGAEAGGRLVPVGAGVRTRACRLRHRAGRRSLPRRGHSSARRTGILQTAPGDRGGGCPARLSVAEGHGAGGAADATGQARCEPRCPVRCLARRSA